jgi:hypothetical protein
MTNTQSLQRYNIGMVLRFQAKAPEAKDAPADGRDAVQLSE